MPTLEIMSNTYSVSDNRVARESTRMFRRMSPERRAQRVEKSIADIKQRIKDGYGIEDGKLRKQLAVVLSQGVTSL